MKTAFTLVEVLIVVLILGILAAIVLPQFSNASAVSRISMMADDLRIVRMQIEVFKAQHNGVPPGYPDCNTRNAPTAQAFSDYMTQSSDANGTIGAGSKVFGPYLREVPQNPVNEKNGVLVLEDGAEFPSEASDEHGWIFQPDTLIFRSDAKGADETGKAFFSY